MKRGIHTETHVVVYCDTCGDIFQPSSGRPGCFTTVNEAVEFINADTATGWDYDGDTVRCDACAAAEHCRTYGHEMVLEGVWAELVSGPYVCAMCGLLETDIPEQEK
ncbi:hypothetical protein [Nocardia sp. AG03]|uniref:hypothetical protein n=1 Tax=Nocardia sp. AG03 TaxID=3025312 RepID=UPI00241861D8|nr:hypothetical protein [Nocardia sp. AG03]